MDVVTDAGADHWRNVECRMARKASRLLVCHLSIRASFVIHYNFKSIKPFDATMLYLSFMFSRGRRSTVPPAFSTRSEPAAMSHKLIPVSMYASNRPQAT